MRGTRIGIALFGLLALAAPAAEAQVVAFQPIPAPLPDGASLGVTPVVTADRRYVRLSVNPQFQGFVAFDTFPVPAAVSGFGGGNLGGLGGLGGGRAGGGLASVPAGMGGNFVAGMNGVEGAAGGGLSAVGTPSASSFGRDGSFATSDMFQAAMSRPRPAPVVAPRARGSASRSAAHRSTARKRAAVSKPKHTAATKPAEPGL